MQKEYITLKIKDIIPYEKNPRKNDAAVPDVAESIKQVGYITPIVVDENNVILCGHTRLKALKKNGEKEVDGVLRVSGLTEEQKRKYRLLDNKTNEKAEWDFDLLAEEIADLDFSGFELDWGMEKENKKQIEDGEVEFTEELLLTHNYIVLYFDNDFDWEVAQEKFGLKQVKDLIPRKGQPKGIGRVINGKEVLKWQN